MKSSSEAAQRSTPPGHHSEELIQGRDDDGLLWCSMVKGSSEARMMMGSSGVGQRYTAPRSCGDALPIKS